MSNSNVELRNTNRIERALNPAKEMSWSNEIRFSSRLLQQNTRVNCRRWCWIRRKVRLQNDNWNIFHFVSQTASAKCKKLFVRKDEHKDPIFPYLTNNTVSAGRFTKEPASMEPTRLFVKYLDDSLNTSQIIRVQLRLTFLAAPRWNWTHSVVWQWERCSWSPCDHVLALVLLIAWALKIIGNVHELNENANKQDHQTSEAVKQVWPQRGEHIIVRRSAKKFRWFQDSNGLMNASKHGCQRTHAGEDSTR